MLCRARGAIAAALVAAVITAGDTHAQAPAGSIVTLHLSDRHAPLRARAESAARESADRYQEWLGPPPSPAFTIADDAAWVGSPEAMNVEARVAYEIARGWLSPRPTSDATTNGISWYLQSRVVEQLYEYAFHNAGYRGEVVSFLGGHITRSFTYLRLSRATAGLGRIDAGVSWPRSPELVPASVDREALRVAVALASIERSIGWPALQGGLLEAARELKSTPLSINRLGEILSNATGQNVGEVLSAYQGAGRWDFSVEDLKTRPCTGRPCMISTVAVARHGEPSPRPLELRVDFQDGQTLQARWDGQASRTFEFEAPTPVTGVHLDPDHAMLLDGNRLNNDRLVGTRTNAPLFKWIARWMIWLQDAALTYSGAL